MYKQFLAFLFFSLAAVAQPTGPIPLWKQLPPGDPGVAGPERDITTPQDRTLAGRRVARFSDVSVPTLAVYQPRKELRSGAAVLVFPGGAYQRLSVDLEGTEICDWLNSIGVTAILVKYRVPTRKDIAPWVLPLQDGQRALEIVRERAAEWHIDPKRVGVIGFSAGGHLAALVSTRSPRPDFAMLIYPAYLTQKDSSQLSAEFPDVSTAPPTFILQTEDDSIRVENALAWYAALKAAKVPVELHLYAAGGHGYGLRPTKDLVTAWPARAQDWLRSLGALK